MNIRPSSDQIKQPDRPKLADIMGPGLITGASDDDPSGIATYSQAGAQFGYSLGWTLLLTYPLMCAIQMISAQVGRVTGKGLAGNMRRHYPAPVIYPLIAAPHRQHYQYRGRSRSDGRGVAASGRRAAAGFRRRFCHRHRPA
jgi:hypothetical protein